MRRGALHAWLACATCLSVAGCLPIPWTEPLSPPIDGRYWNAADGAPIAGARIALSTALRDSTCALPARETTTDASGAFSFPGTEVRHSMVILLPIDRVRGTYHLCSQVRDSLRPMFRGWFLSRVEVRRDTVACEQRVASSASPSGCTTRDPRWTASDARGRP